MSTHICVIVNTQIVIKGITREGVEGTEAPPLSKSKLRKEIKY